MVETIKLGDVVIAVTRKDVKNVHLSVHPPSGPRDAGRADRNPPGGGSGLRIYKARLDSRPAGEAARAGARDSPASSSSARTTTSGGGAICCRSSRRTQKPSVTLDHRRITLSVRPGSDRAKREAVMHEWHKSLLHEAVPALIQKWEPRLGVKVSGYFLQRMKTKWGGCNHQAGNIRLNTELVKKPKDLLEYVVVHEMVHLIEPTHSERFVALLTEHYPTWREARAELNELPLTAEVWRE